MTKETPNIFQRFARKIVREAINDYNNSLKKSQYKKKKNKKKTSSKNSQSIKTKRSRYISNSNRVTVLKRDKFRCVYCGRNSKQIELEIDHIVPFSKAGSNEISNLQTLCIDCNRGKGSRLL